MFLGEMNLISTWVSILILKSKIKSFLWDVYMVMNLRKKGLDLFLNLADINFLYGNHAKVFC